MAQGCEYFISFWNVIDMLGLLFTFVVVLATAIASDAALFQALRVIAAFASCFTLLKLFDWLRLFEETAFYVLLAGVTLHDIRYFLLLLATTLMMFGVPLVMLDQSSE